jgi:UDP-2-acetamido-3-amino-2,3-dideoxy-glucuronate N-acetyltransferase
MGAGRWGTNVVRTLSRTAGAELLWVADPDPAARERAELVSPKSRTCASVARALDEVDAVAICTPAADHYEHAAEILAAGKHALVEKPLATSAAGAQRLSDRADAAGLTLMVGHQLLFHPLFAELEGLVRGGALGELREIRAQRSGVVDFDSEPGVLWAYGPHDVSMVLALSGDVPARVRGTGELDRAHGVVGRAAIDLEFAAGPVAGVDLDGASATRRRRLAVIGQRGQAVFDDAEPGGRLTLDGDEQLEIEPDPKRRFAPLERSCRHFVECVVRDERPRTGGPHGHLVTELIERAASAIDAAFGETRSSLRS